MCLHFHLQASSSLCDHAVRMNCTFHTSYGANKANKAAALHVLCSLQIFATTIFQNSFVYKCPNLNAYNIYQIEAVAIVGSRYRFFVHRSHVLNLDVQICAKL